MEVKIVFDTEKDSVEDLKKLVKYLQNLIEKKEANNFDQQPVQNNEQKKTEGGCSIVPFQDMSDTMEKIYNGKKDF